MEICQETLKKVANTINSHNMIGPGERIAVAVSGGADSICLLDVLFQLRKELESELVVAHFDHGLRPGDDDAETQFVRSLAESYGLRFIVEKAHKSLGSEKGFSEERARELRYRFFYQVLENTSSSKIAVGHNLDDQAETVLMRLLRGSGPSGLGGIPPVRENRIIRPLIDLKRIEIESYLKTQGLKYITDPTNFDKAHLRNRVRLELIPMLEGYQPRVTEILGQTADILRQDESWLSKEAKAWLSRNARFSGDHEIEIEVDNFRDLPGPLRSRVIRSVIEMLEGRLLGLSLCHIDSVTRLTESEKSHSNLDLPGRLTASKVYNKLIFSTNSVPPMDDYCFFLERPGNYSLEELGCSLSIEECKGKDMEEFNQNPTIAYLDGEKLSFPLVVRNFRPGDRFIPLGMKGHKKVKDFFIDLKIPLNDRKRLPILTYGDKPVWIFGLRIDDRFKVRPDTKKVIRVAWERP